jgi:transcriptional regulator with XRE-family HTH domain
MESDTFVAGEHWQAELTRVRRRLGDNVRAAREQAGLSQEELARACLIRRSTISRIEKGEQEPRVTTLLAFSRALGVSFGTLTAGVEINLAATDRQPAF